MAGHSKFKNIQHRKGAQDAKRAKIFTKIGREIIVATKLSGGDPSANPRLRAAITAGRAVNMPNERIKKAIDTGLGAGNADNYESIRYEGYGPNGVAVIVEALTDNRTRTVGEVRSYFTKVGGVLGETNSVGFMFDRVGEIIYPVTKASADAMFESAVEAGAENAESDDENHIVTCSIDDYAAVREKLVEKYGEPEKSGMIFKPNVMTNVDEETAKSIIKLTDLLEDNDDVQAVYTNFEVADDIMERLMA
jgi:YebC/PmpR family DNA-binding regulatory protein